MSNLGPKTYIKIIVLLADVYYNSRYDYIQVLNNILKAVRLLPYLFGIVIGIKK